MPSLITDKKSKRDIKYRIGYSLNGERKHIKLGRIPAKTARSIFAHFERMYYAKINGEDYDEITLDWLAKISDERYRQFERKGFVKARNLAPLLDFIDDYIDKHDSGDSSKTIMKRARGYLADYFGNADMRTITIEDAKAWAKATKEAKNRAENTVRRATGYARQFFNAAIERGIVRKNPFKALPASLVKVQERMHFITDEAAYALIDNAPSDEWKALIAVMRWAGTRNPSELIPMRWEHVVWDEQKMKVMNIKTKRHKTTFRDVPLFAKYKVFLEAIRRDSGWVFPMLHEIGGDSVHRRITYELERRIIPDAGLKKWPRLLQAFRASCATGLIIDGNTFERASLIMGHSVEKLKSNYLMQTDEMNKAALALSDVG